ncbi:hypothetical protein W97_07288 [Coniosporium apollinis CBS 100218]|uniref:Major facilitator superfamily (MFS) profile domain-containing protein n=1 Tax=Coniosporium apollinis (strain CBS 100218) TaxID=1168221 RepID=R7Z298_CONA1|nr:uncharacterized protein W97_07288 [Coniosporium apollinis CBS 100218]EON68139.1 hypothetical protein W97_07288 [Coniosporium apollinis CBS 100218]
MVDIENLEKGDVVYAEKLADEEIRHVQVSAARQTHIRRKFDRHVLPIVCCLYVLSYLDRGNIGNARVAGAQDDLGLDSYQWSWVLNAFYICYVCFEWTTLMWKLLPAHIYVAVLCICWGAAAMCSGVVNNMAGLVVCRCFLGIFEAAFGAGAPVFLSFFYQRHEVGLRVSLLLGMAPLANTFASSLAYGITQIKNSLAPWRLLFLIEGAPTVLFAFVVYFYLADSPGTAKFLTEAEQTEAVERMNQVDRTAKTKVNKAQFLSGLTDYKPYIHTMIHFSCNYSFAALSNFLPTIVQGMGYSSINAQGLTAPAYFVAFLLCVAVAFTSDKLGKRGYFVASFAAMGTVGYLLLAVVQDTTKIGVRYLGVWLAACGVFPALVINITWMLNNQGGDSKKGAGFAILATVGQMSSFVSSVVFPTTDRPFYTKGCALGCGFTGLIVILSLGLHFKLQHENRKRDRLYGKVPEDAQIDVTQGGDNNPNFRYFT